MKQRHTLIRPTPLPTPSYRIGWAAGDEGGLLWCDPILTPRRDRERLASLVFERFNVSGLHVADAPVLALYSVGRLSGTVVDIGHDAVDVACVVDGAVVPPTTRRVAGTGGVAADAALAAALAARGALPPDTPIEMVRAAKAALLSAKPGASVEVSLGSGTRATLLPADATTARSALLSGSPDPTDPTVAQAVALCAGAVLDAPTRRSALEGLLVCGGGAGAVGLADTLAADAALATSHLGAAPLVAVPDYMPGGTLAHAAWCGGAVLSRVVFAQGQAVTKAEYDEYGPAVVHKKCTP